MASHTQEELERKMLERVGILPKKPPIVSGIKAYVRAMRAHGYDEEPTILPAMIITDLLSDFVGASLVEKRPLIKRIEHLEKTIRDLKKEKETEEVFSKADLIYYKFKDELEKEHFGKIIAIDVDSEKIVGIGNSVLEAYSEAKKNSSKKQFSYRRVGFDFVHRL